MYHQRRVRKGFGGDVAIALYSAAMQAISLSNVRFADWVKRHACGLPTAAAVADRRHGSAILVTQSCKIMVKKHDKRMKKM